MDWHWPIISATIYLKGCGAGRGSIIADIFTLGEDHIGRYRRGYFRDPDLRLRPTLAAQHNPAGRMCRYAPCRKMECSGIPCSLDSRQKTDGNLCTPDNRFHHVMLCARVLPFISKWTQDRLHECQRLLHVPRQQRSD